jgi:hypothetical protein
VLKTPTAKPGVPINTILKFSVFMQTTYYISCKGNKTLTHEHSFHR